MVVKHRFMEVTKRFIKQIHFIMEVIIPKIMGTFNDLINFMISCYKGKHLSYIYPMGLGNVIITIMMKSFFFQETQHLILNGARFIEHQYLSFFWNTISF